MSEEFSKEDQAEESSEAESHPISEVVEGEPPGESVLGKFSIVGIGASAGGLEAMTEVLRNVLPDSMAYIVVQHLAPSHESIMAEILSRSTGLPVQTAVDGVAVEPNHIYVNPPNADITIAEGKIRVTTPPAPGRPPFPIDIFFRSLAEQVGRRAIGVVLSGTGTDGSLGLQAVKAAGGITFAQDPATARYDGMPRSAVERGFADFCLPPQGIAKSLMEISDHPFLKRGEPPSLGAEDSYRLLFNAVRKETGIDLSYYKRATINRRLDRRMALNKAEKLEGYVRFALTSVAELRALCRDILISVTSFFRDRHPFDMLQNKIFPEMLATKAPGDPIRIWVPACATGEEVYSIAICLLEVLGERAQEFTIQVFGTDVEAEAVRHARMGIYPPSISIDVSQQRLRRFFEKRDDGYQVVRRVRDMVVFSTQSLTSDPPFSRIDLISCRNLLIYLQPYMQARVLRTLHYALVPGGTLLLGTSESLGESAGLFEPVDRRSKAYVKKQVTTVSAMDISGIRQQGTGGARPPRQASVLQVAERRILERYGPPGALINENWEVLQFHGRTWRYLEHVSGLATLNILKLARREFQLPLRSVITKVLAESHSASQLVRVDRDGRTQTVRIDGVPITDEESNTRCVLILFVETEPEKETPESTSETTPPQEDKTLELERELLQTREYLQTTIEELETSNEELKSSNEELQSSNEELQSINEEIETSKEELQSTNEELTTVNDVLQVRMEELTQSNDDLNNILTGLDTLVLLTGMDHRVRRFNTSAGRVIGLGSSDLGRPVSRLDSFLEGIKLEELVREAMRRADPVEQIARATNQRWYKVRVAPYRAQDQVIQGTVILLVDINVQMRTEEIGRGVESYVADHLGAAADPMVAIDSSFRMVWGNPSYFSTFQSTSEEVLGERLRDVGTGEWGSAGMQEQVRLALVEGKPFHDFRVSHVFRKIGPLTFRVSGSHLDIGGERVALLKFEPDSSPGGRPS